MKTLTLFGVLGAAALVFLGAGCGKISKVNPLLPSSNAKLSYRVGCYSTKAWVDPNANTWYPDQAYVVGAGYGYDASMFNWANSNGATTYGAWNTLYQNQRQGSEIEYYFEVDPGAYKVTLKMAEYWPGGAANGREFNIEIPRGNPVATNLCVFDRAGGKELPFELSWTTYCSSRLLTVYFKNVLNNAMINAIEVVGQ